VRETENIPKTSKRGRGNKREERENQGGRERRAHGCGELARPEWRRRPAGRDQRRKRERRELSAAREERRTLVG